MGHERSGLLPRTQRWRDVVKDLQSAAHSPEEVSNIAAQTLRNVRSRFDQIHRDPGVQAAFGFLVALATQTQQAKGGPAAVDTGIGESPSIIRVVKTLKRWVRENADSLEYAALAEKAAADAISKWTSLQLAQPSLFATGDDTQEVWTRASTGSGFCQVARFFFASFTERYLNYFLGREASAEVSSISERDRIAAELSRHVEEVSRHAFELATITQSFSAGWYNKHARDEGPTRREVERFLAVAFAKVREELLRESED